MTTRAEPAPTGRFPEWMRRRIPPAGKSDEVARLLGKLRLNTVCRSARCPNQAECFARGTATFMILGSVCTRDCHFCAVPTGHPCLIDSDEPKAVAEAAARLGLKHVVITSVTRDDLPDGGAAHFCAVIEAVRARLTHATVEVLTPDFAGKTSDVDAVVSAGPEVFNHNVETVPRLYRHVRPQAQYHRSLDVLARAGKQANDAGIKMLTKSGLMLGLGETDAELLDVFADLRREGVSLLTLGQYLAPSPEHAPIARFVTPGEFDSLRRKALGMGFSAVAAGPYVRSSYLAGMLLSETKR